jgi:hypothetical protein
VVLNGFGGVTIGCADVFERWQRIVVYAGGTLWRLDRLLIQHFASIAMDHPLAWHAWMALPRINVGMAVINLIPLGPPLDGWYIAREAYGFFREQRRPAWEQDPDWWKRGAVRADASWAVRPQ